ncbi:MAG: hypothetical protein LR011_00925 [Verrucomicrobia bacterium]|nr:hypothetical protein [Verrucomicrobiota bacterium]
MASNPSSPVKSWADHEKDWSPGDPEWQGGKGHGIVGALNYLASTGANAFSFLTYNAGGDGDNIWPFTSRDDKFHYDVSKLDQWGILLDHATSLGLYLHFKLQETEMDDDRHGPNRKIKATPESLDGGQLGDERKLYCRELIARFAHNLALNWNIGEENTQSTAEIQAMADYLHRMDPYQNPIVIHTYPQEQDKVYTPLLGNQSRLTGVSLQNEWNISHQRVLYWIQTSQSTGRPWVVANDEQGPADLGVPPDPGFENFSGTVAHKNSSYDLNSIRKFTLWGTLLAGGAGVEYYFGYKLPQNDLYAQNWRSRDLSWKYAAIALRFFEDHQIPFHLMENRDDLVGNPTHSNERYCFAQAGSIYIIYLPEGGTSHIDLSSTPEDKQFQIRWFNPRHGGPLTEGSIQSIQGGSIANIGMPPDATDSDWLVLLR